MKILVLGGGGREHALIWKLSYSPERPRIFVAPGNPGVGTLATRVPIDPSDQNAICRFAQIERIDLVIVGPEGPLVAGIADRLERVGIMCLGPGRLGAMLEGSKSFAKVVMEQYKIPTAAYEVFRSVDPAMDYIRSSGGRVVIKADGLCAGKGVFLPETEAESKMILDDILVGKRFGSQGEAVVIEECLTGTESSFICFCDGSTALPMQAAQDYKRVGDGDTGPNTGGMGAVSPSPVMTPSLEKIVMETIVYPLLRGLREAGTPYRGILYVGLMITATGPKVLEFNVRFGDPEAQAILPRLNSDLLEVVLGCCEGGLENIRPIWDRRPAVCVVLASKDYPEASKSGHEITGLDGLDSADVIITHAGTRQEGDNIVTNGGRVLGITGLALDLDTARQLAYTTIESIKFKGMRYRKDIGETIP